MRRLDPNDTRPNVARVVEVYRSADDERGSLGSGTGHLVGNDLILTAAHVVRGCQSMHVRLASGSVLLRCEVVWQRYDGPNRGVDAALLRVIDPLPAPLRPTPVRWGRMVSGVACEVEATGFPAGMQVWDDGRLKYRDTAHCRGEIMPGSRMKSGRHDLQLHRPIPREGVNLPSAKRRRSSRWCGMSGAAVCAGDLVVGIVVEDWDQSGGSLVVVPSGALLADTEFRRHIGVAHVFPVGLDEVLERPGSPARTPIGLLRADAATVRFHGRDDVVADVLDWCDDSDPFTVRLVTGRAGEGKSRLAHELVGRLKDVGWCAGFLDPTCPDERLSSLSDVTEPLFLVVDYAEGRSEQVKNLIRLLDSGSRYANASPVVRLLLLARATGTWWEGLRTSIRLLRHLPQHRITVLRELEPGDARCLDAYKDAVVDLLAALARIERYREAVAGIDPAAVAPPCRPLPSGRALAVQMAALVGLLQHLSPVEAGQDEPDEKIMLYHEARFWDETAPVHGLRHLHRKTLQQLVAAATLCPVITSAEAIDLLGRLSVLNGETENTKIGVASWLHELYTSDGRYWDALVPDAIGEYLVGQVGVEFPRLLADIGDHVDESGAELMLVVLCRAAVLFPSLSDSVIRQVLSRPRPLAFAAITAAIRGDHPVLVEALGRLVAMKTVDPGLLGDLVAAIPRNTVALAQWAVQLATRLVDLHTPEPEDGRGVAELAEACRQLAFRLAEVGRQDEALGHAAEAVRLHRGVTGRPGAARDGLVEALLAYSGRLVETGRTVEAVDAVGEAVRLRRAMNSSSPSGRACLAAALHQQALCLHEAGRYAEAVVAGGEAVRIRSSLMATSRHFAADLASSNLNYAGYLHDVGRGLDGLRYAREAVTAYRELAERSHDTYEVRLGLALQSLTRLLAPVDPVEAMASAEEAVAVHRHSVRSGSAGPLVEALSIAVANYGRRLAACGFTQEAIEAMEEAEELCVRLAGSRSKAVTDRLAAVRRDLVVLRRVADLPSS
ncbi:trypsin-like peptidase domain-containing protein [Lentzea sp. NPDC092896]|uniref:trypsin-like peptidase domain-containing protein n=1 Tax=Lentzea sp. NPDC092896 TaxID=3364127 RepID=UPI003820A1A3